MPAFQELLRAKYSPRKRAAGRPPGARMHLARLLLVGGLGWAAGHLAGAEVSMASHDGFALPQPGTRFVFPRDHGSHPEFKIEWWYLTGHLETTNHQPATPRRFGFQATFFRRAAPHSKEPGVPSESFASDQLHLAHMALLDGQTGQFHHEERLNRRGWDADSATNTLAVRNGNWSLRLNPSSTASPTASSTEVFQLHGSIRAEVRFSLQLTPVKPLVVFGTNGISRKAAESWASSHYLTYPRLATHGTVQVGTTTFEVRGTAWMDHEISSSQLGAGQVGWDWACLQLNDGRELMAYRMRRADGTTDPFSTVAWIDRDGRTIHQPADRFSFTPEGVWQSPQTRAEYPAKIRLSSVDPETGKLRVFRLEPLAPDQELAGGLGGIPYWEGACRVLDSTGTEIGQAYLEMTGYAGSLRSTME